MKETFFYQRVLLPLYLLFFGCAVLAQSSSYISYSSSNNGGSYTYTFEPNLQNLLADYPLDYSHPEAGYIFFWSFGDGSYSFEETVTHKYAENEDVTVTMVASPVYSPIDPPPFFAETIAVFKGSSGTPNTDEMLLLSRDPRPGYSSYAIVNYENTLNTPVKNAKLRFYYNSEYFTHLGEQLFNGEAVINKTTDSSLLPKYDSYITYSVGNLSIGEQHTIMVDLETLLGAMGPLGEDLPDLYMYAELFYDIKTRSGTTEHLIEDMEIVSQAVGGWDPNDKVVFTDEFFHNQMGNQEWVEYQVNFQNIGIAPAKIVKIIDTFSIDFDSSTFVLTDYYHPSISIYNGFSYNFNASTRILNCRFLNINLSGLNQTGITDPEETMGYIKFKVKTKPKSVFNPSLYTIIDTCMPYHRLENQAHIIFDKNDPIATNIAYTDLYASSNANCFNSRSDNSTKPEFTVYPNPISGSQIVISANNLPSSFSGFTASNVGISIYNSSFSQTTCNLNPSFRYIAGVYHIVLNPSCLSSGINYILLTYGGQTYRMIIVV